MIRRLVAALRVALREEDFSRVLGAAVLLIALGTMTFRFSTDWSVADSFYVAVATLTTSSIMNPNLTIDDPWLGIFTAAYVLIGIGILVEVARRLGMGFIAAREEVRTAKRDEATLPAAPGIRDQPALSWASVRQCPLTACRRTSRSRLSRGRRWPWASWYPSR